MYISMLAHTHRSLKLSSFSSLFASQPVIIIDASLCLLIPSFAHSNLLSNPSSFFLTVQPNHLLIFEM